MTHTLPMLFVFTALVAGCRSDGPGASGKQERCGRLYERLIECKGFSEPVLREFDGKDAFVDACVKEWRQSRKTVACLDEETCESFHRCAFGMSARDLKMLESIGTPPAQKTEPPPTSEPAATDMPADPPVGTAEPPAGTAEPPPASKASEAGPSPPAPEM